MRMGSSPTLPPSMAWLVLGLRSGLGIGRGSDCGCMRGGVQVRGVEIGAEVHAGGWVRVGFLGLGLGLGSLTFCSPLSSIAAAARVAWILPPSGTWMG